MSVSPKLVLPISAKSKSPVVSVRPPTVPLAVASREVPWRWAVYLKPSLWNLFVEGAPADRSLTGPGRIRIDRDVDAADGVEVRVVGACRGRQAGAAEARA